VGVLLSYSGLWSAMFGRILLAVDDSAASRGAVALAADIARNSSAEVLVFHVRERQWGRRGTKLELESQEDASEFVNSAVYDLRRAGVSARGELRHGKFGSVARGIATAAEEHGSELIVMGSRGLACVPGMVRSSVSHKVLHLAHIPVLIARS
jgi:nucleotide-binding universal stress UspA family protein